MRRLLMLCCLLTLSCATVPPTPTPAYTCATACAHGAVLDCDWARWNPLEGSCAAQCADWRDTWGYNMQCMTTATTCEAAERCQSPVYGAHRLTRTKE